MTADSVLDWVLDASIFFSFDRSGYVRHSRKYRSEDLDVDLTGRVCAVTGANSGIGLATARALAERGASVWMLCRNAERGGEAQRVVRDQTGNPNVHMQVLDVSNLRSVREFAKDFSPTAVDVLVHNAGLLPGQREETAEAIEITLATHVVGPFLMTQLLLPKLRAAQQARVVFVSSAGMYTQRLSLADPHWRKRAYDGVAAYAQTKRMQVVLAELLAKRLKGSGIEFHSMHPGWADTPGVRGSLPGFWRWMRGRLRTPEQGADTVVWLAMSAAAGGEENGKFWFDRAPSVTHLLPLTREKREDRDRLWRLCVRLSDSPRGGGARTSREASQPQERRRAAAKDMSRDLRG